MLLIAAASASANAEMSIVGATGAGYGEETGASWGFACRLDEVGFEGCDSTLWGCGSGAVWFCGMVGACLDVVGRLCVNAANASASVACEMFTGAVLWLLLDGW